MIDHNAQNNYAHKKSVCTSCTFIVDINNSNLQKSTCNNTDEKTEPLAVHRTGARGKKVVCGNRATYPKMNLPNETRRKKGDVYVFAYV